MDPNASFSNRYRRWWLGGEQGDLHLFMAEEFGETQRGLMLIMAVGAVLFFVRGMLEIWANTGPGWQDEFIFRLVGGLVFGFLTYVFKMVPFKHRGTVFCVYLFLYIGGTAFWAPQHGLHIGYLAVPITLCIAFGMLMWPRIDGLYWPVLAVVIPALGMLIRTNAPPRDWAIYFFYFLVSVTFAVTVRRTRMRTAFALFVFRENLRNKADRDPLTGLLNRAGWREQAGNLCEAARMSALPATVVFFDIDHFKRVNDVHGHAAGDRVLINVAQLLEQGLRPGDVLARLGGEEFVAAMLGVGAEEGSEIANRLRRGVKDAKSTIPVTISAGVAEITPNQDLAQAMHQADMGLLEAKQKGRNQVCFAPSSPDTA